MFRIKFPARVMLGSLLFAMSGALGANSDAEWRFRVYLDDREIGHHFFRLSREDGVSRLTSEANFEVRVLFVKLFEYEHRNEEIWHGDCLASIDSVTDANGRPFNVRGQRQGDQFLVQGSEGTEELPACVMSFAYWNPEFLGQKRLLNSQNGQYLPVEVAELGRETLRRDGTEHQARRYRLQAGELDLLLWYSEQDEWLALETEAQGGRRLRYELL